MRTLVENKLFNGQYCCYNYYEFLEIFKNIFSYIFGKKKKGKPLALGQADSGPTEAHQGSAERKMCPWAISKYFGDWVPTQVLLCWSMQCGGQSANHVKRYVSQT
jgi:hypothetical protein